MANNVWLQRPSVLSRQPSTSLLTYSLGGKGKHSSQFDNCNSLATLSNGNIAIADTNNNRIQIISSRGIHIKTVGENKLRSPWAVTALPFENFCVSEGLKKRIVIYTEAGDFVSKFNVKEVEEPCALATCPVSGNIVVTDYHSEQVFIYDLDGTLVTYFKTQPDQLSSEIPTAEQVAVDNEGNMFLTFGTGCSEIQVYDNLGDFKFKFGNFTSACGVHITAKGNVLIVEREERSVNMYSQTGQFIQQLLNPASGLQGYPHNVTVVNGNMVVLTASDDMYGCPTWVHFYKVG